MIIPRFLDQYATLKLIEFYQDPISEYEGILTETLDDIIIKTKNCNYIAVQVKTKKKHKIIKKYRSGKSKLEEVIIKFMN